MASGARCFRSGEPGELGLSGSSTVARPSCDKSDLLNLSTTYRLTATSFGLGSLGISEIF